MLRHNTYTAPQAATAAPAALYVTNRAGERPVGHKLKPATRLWPTTNSHTQHGLPFNGLHSRYPCNYYIDYYSFTESEGTEGWVGLVGWPIAYTIPTKWSHTIHQGKSASQRPTS